MIGVSSLMHSTHSFLNSLLMYMVLPLASKSSPSTLRLLEKKDAVSFALAIA